MSGNESVKFLLQERIFLLKSFYQFNRNYDLINEMFREKFMNSCVSHRNYLLRLAAKFEETSSVLNASHSGQLCSVYTQSRS